MRHLNVSVPGPSRCFSATDELYSLQSSSETSEPSGSKSHDLSQYVMTGDSTQCA